MSESDSSIRRLEAQERATQPLSQEIEDKYELLRPIKEGGMGALYLVKHRQLDVIRIIKTIRPQFSDDEPTQRRFLREARAVTLLEHPNIVRLHDYSVDHRNVAYMVMEYIEGVTVREILATERLPSVSLCMEIARQALSGLGFLHRHGYVHRDISPENVMVARDADSKPVIKLIDLGIVKHLDDSHHELTGSGAFLGKIKYSAPEQWSGTDSSPGPATDLYSFGLLLYELLTGTFPLSGAKTSEFMWAHRFAQPLDFATTDPDGRVAENLREAILRTLEKDPEKRPASAEELLEMIGTGEGEVSPEQDLDDALSRAVDTLLPADPEGGSGEIKADSETPPPVANNPVQRDEDSGHNPHLTLVIDNSSGLVATLIAEAEQRLRNGELEEARKRLHRVLSMQPDDTLARDMLATVESKLEQATIEAAGKHQKETELAAEAALLAATDLPAAIDKLETVLSARPDDPATKGLLETYQQELADQLQRRAIQDSVAFVEVELARENVTAAQRLLDVYRQQQGDNAAFTKVEQRVVDKREELAARERDAQIQKLLAAAAAQAESGDWESAEAESAEALRVQPEHPEALRLWDEYRSALAQKREEHRRLEALEEAVVGIQRLLEQGSLDAAQKQLAHAEKLFGDESALGEARRSLDEAQQNRQLEALLQEAKALADEAKFEEAIGLLEKTPTLRKRPETRDLLKSCRLKEAAEQKRRTATQNAILSIEEAIEQSDIATARKLLSRRIAELGNDERFAVLEERLTRLEQRRLDDKVDSKVAAARRLLRRGRTREAIVELQAALSIEPEDVGLRCLVESYRNDLERQGARRAG